MSRVFKRKYDAMWSDETVGDDGFIVLSNGKQLTKTTYGRRKFQVIRSMTDKELVSAFGKQFGFTTTTPREDMMKKLRQQSWKI